MLISKEQCKYNVADADDPRKNVSCIGFEKIGAVSTDGKRVMIVPYPMCDDNDLFVTEESKADAKYKLKKDESILINADTAKHLAGNFFKANEQENIVGRLAAVEVKKKTIFISMVSDIVDKEFEVKKIEANPFNWKAIIPKSKVTGTTMFNLNLLIDTLKQIKGASQAEAECPVTFKFHGDIGIVELSTPDNQFTKEVKAYIVPMRDKE